MLPGPVEVDLALLEAGLGAVFGRASAGSFFSCLAAAFSALLFLEKMAIVNYSERAPRKDVLLNDDARVGMMTKCS